MRELQLLFITAASSSIQLPHQQPSFKPTKSSSSSSIRSWPPLHLSNVRSGLSPARRTRLKYYADLASKLAGNGRFDDFLMVAESVLTSKASSDPSPFLASVNFKLVSAGISALLRDGKLQQVVDVLGRVEKLGIRPSSLLTNSARDLLGFECLRLVDDGRVEEFVELAEILAGYEFSVKDFVEPFSILKLCIEKHNPNMAARYASILPNSHIMFSSIICEYGKKRDLESALIVYKASMAKLDTPNMYVCRSIIDICGLCGDCLRSRCIFEELLRQNVTPNVYVFNSLMNVNGHDLNYTMRVYKHMQAMHVAADVISYNILLKACVLAGRVDLVQDTYEEVKQMASTGSLKLDTITYSTVIKVFADAKMWQMALKVKEDMLYADVKPNIITWSSLISAFANAGLVERAIQVFEEMLNAGCEPNSQCCNTLLYACVESCQFDRAFRLFQSWMESGFQINHAKACNQNTVGIGVELGSEEDLARTSSCNNNQHHLCLSKVGGFKPTVATYNILMKACGSDYYHAKALMDEMRVTGLRPNHISWSILIDICGSSHNMRGAMQAFKNMKDEGIKLDVVAYTTVIKACVENKNLKIACWLFEEMKRNGLRPNLVTYNTLLRARSRNGSLHEVQRCLAIYQEMRKAGYSSNDYFLKELIEEWCEGVIKDNEKDQLSLSKRSYKTDTYKLQSLLLEKVAVLLQNDIEKCLFVDLQGLSKIEARIVVLSVLRMIKESYYQGLSIEDDLIIITGAGKDGLDAASIGPHVQAAVIKLLRDELGLNVLAGHQIDLVRNELLAHPDSDLAHGFPRKNCYSRKLNSSARRPPDLGRLMVPQKSLNHWLQKRADNKR